MWLNDTIRALTTEGKNPHDSYAMMLDTDTILNARPLKQVWAKFDCARKGKPILMGGETGCWFGVQCKNRHIVRYYEPLGPTLNAFINSGYIMGSLPALQKMFSFIANNYSYFRKIIYWVHWFCDQSAFTYFYAHNRDIVQIDEYQQVFATLSVFTEGGRKPSNVCRSSHRTHNGQNIVVQNCSEVLYPAQIFAVDPNTCVASINISLLDGAPQARKIRSVLSPYISQMSADPVVFHGNAGGKAVTKMLRPIIQRCLYNKYYVKEFNGKFILDGNE